MVNKLLKLTNGFHLVKFVHIVSIMTVKKALNIREWKCSNCHTKHDRDINAAINIKNKGLEMIS